MFASENPDAPLRLDDRDPDHADWIRAWLDIRDQILADWVDDVFRQFFPAAGRLDPQDPGDAQLIDYWNDIRDQIRDGAEGRYLWEDPPPGSEPDQGVTAEPEPDAEVSLEGDDADGTVFTADTLQEERTSRSGRAMRSRART